MPLSHFPSIILRRPGLRLYSLHSVLLLTRTHRELCREWDTIWDALLPFRGGKAGDQEDWLGPFLCPTPPSGPLIEPQEVVQQKEAD
jgi:hypothetical protein